MSYHIALSGSESSIYPSHIHVWVKDVYGHVHEMHLDEKHLRDVDGAHSVDVGVPVARDPIMRRVLVGLPKQTTRGFWRIWVDEDELLGGA